MHSAPRLETERLTLRGFTAADLDAHAAMLADDEVMRFIGGTGLSREEAWRKLAAGVGLWVLQGHGLWAVERTADGVLIGHVGLFDFHREMTPSIEGEPEMGWVFVRDAHGQGYAREACEAALAWADAELGVAIPAIIALENGASIRLAERLGFVRVGDAEYKGELFALFRRGARGLRGNWEEPGVAAKPRRRSCHEGSL